MAFVIGDSCTCCGTCRNICPVFAISKGDEHFEIDQTVCLHCGNCIVKCPFGAISQC